MIKKNKIQRPASQALLRATQASSPRAIDSVWLPALCSCLLLIAAFPPWSIYPLAWVAPVGWLLVCQRSLPVGRKGYFQLWLSGCLFWLVSLHSVRLAFWVLHFGWIAMALYLAIYIPIMVATTRVFVHRWRVPLWIAAPVTWTGCELLRSVLLTGYAGSTLAHSQAWQPLVIQVVDMLGHGGLSFLMVMFAAAVLPWMLSFKPLINAVSAHQTAGDIAATSPPTRLTSAWRKEWRSALVALLVPICVLTYGYWRLEQANREIAVRPALLKCLLLQENTPTVFDAQDRSDSSDEPTESAWVRYIRLCQAAAQKLPALDLVVWPESTFTAANPFYSVEYDDGDLPKWLLEELRQESMNPAQFETNLQLSQQHFDLKVKAALLASQGLEPYDSLTQQNGPDLIVGCEHVKYGNKNIQRQNGAIWIGANGSVKEIYGKMFLVMFGEYIPLRPVLGWLEGVFGFYGTDPGDKPIVFTVKGVQIAPNICFETMVPRFIRWQLQTLQEQGRTPQIMVNLTNDSWFKGTSMLDHHLACSIICCVENRRPLLVAANTGLTAEIDGSGRLLQCTQRLTAQTVYAEPRADGRWGLVQTLGYPLSWMCATLTVAVMVVSPFLRTQAT